MILYGIRNCDSVKKARAWLDGRGVEYRFHDYKVSGYRHGEARSQLQRSRQEALLNRCAGTTFRSSPIPGRRI
jgi:arsenate reductase